MTIINTDTDIERVKVIIHDWNTVHEEGREIVSQDGKIVTLKREYVENK